MSNVKSVNLKRQVFDKSAFNNTVSTEFTQLTTPVDPSFFDVNLATQEDFWILYNKFFYEIPKEGDINSHLYLVQTSGEYINYAPQQEEIEALLEEITELRQENLEVRQEIAQIITDFQ
jgi:hypothetical protein|tara:strand:- start:4510 stop:4866 length:357 start_codon:yes stop_codon:yes gene_type:complete